MKTTVFCRAAPGYANAGSVTKKFIKIYTDDNADCSIGRLKVLNLNLHHGLWFSRKHTIEHFDVFWHFINWLIVRWFQVWPISGSRMQPSLAIAGTILYNRYDGWGRSFLEYLWRKTFREYFIFDSLNKSLSVQCSTILPCLEMINLISYFCISRMFKAHKEVQQVR